MGKLIQWTIPKKFLMKYDLQLGAKVFAIIMIIVMLLIILAAIVDMLGFQTCEDSYSVMRSAYAFSSVTIIYSILLIILNLWFLWGAKHGKPSAVLVWVVVTSLWLTQTTLLTMVLLFLYMADVGLTAWIVCVVCSVIAFLICLYGVLVAYGLWLELKHPDATVATAVTDATNILRPILPK